MLPALPIWTIGHSNYSTELLMEMLAAHGVKMLVDVRLIPKSRFNPQFNTEILRCSLEQAAIGYRHARDLGGRRQEQPGSINTALPSGPFRGYADNMRTDAFRRAHQNLIAWSGEQPTAVMCAEANPEHCHRSLLADSLLLHGINVWHILSATERRPHQLHPRARLEGVRVTYRAAQASMFELQG